MLKERFMRFNSLASATAVAVAVTGLAVLPGAADAASDIDSSAASASLDFQVVIPGIVFLQVGTGQFQADVGTVDTIQFTPTAAELVGGNPVAASSGGDLGPGQATVRVWGNVGQLELSSIATTLDSDGDVIPWTEITVAASNPALPHPAFDADGEMSTLLTTMGNGNSRVTNLQGAWTYSYANSTQPAQGTYTGTVTYTVANP
jgi:hypothetical protein